MLLEIIKEMAQAFIINWKVVVTITIIGTLAAIYYDFKFGLHSKSR